MNIPKLIGVFKDKELPEEFVDVLYVATCVQAIHDLGLKSDEECGLKFHQRPKPSGKSEKLGIPVGTCIALCV